MLWLLADLISAGLKALELTEKVCHCKVSVHSGISRENPGFAGYEPVLVNSEPRMDRMWTSR